MMATPRRRAHGQLDRDSMFCKDLAQRTVHFRTSADGFPAVALTCVALFDVAHLHDTGGFW
jgi:hypothetical protein